MAIADDFELEVFGRVGKAPEGEKKGSKKVVKMVTTFGQNRIFCVKTTAPVAPILVSRPVSKVCKKWCF